MVNGGVFFVFKEVISVERLLLFLFWSMFVSM